MKSRSPKPKFFPPIRTAASFLRSVSKSPEVNIPLSPPTQKEFIPEFPVQKHFTTFLKDSGTFLDRPSGFSSPKNFKDFHLLQEALKSSLDHDQKPQSILPTTPDHLRAMFRASSRLTTRNSSSRGKLCLKEKCLKLTETAEIVDRPILDEKIRIGIERNISVMGSDAIALKEWLKYMKEHYLKKVLNEDLWKGMDKEELEAEIDAFDVILRAGSQEAIKQVSVLCIDRGEIVAELIGYYQMCCKAKVDCVKKTCDAIIIELQKNNKALNEELGKMTSQGSEKLAKLNYDLDLLKSASILKDMEIDSQKDQICKLKAERIYQMKKNLESYNLLIKDFHEYQQIPQNLKDTTTAKALYKKKDSIKELVLNRLDLLLDKKRHQSVRLTEEQLIEHEMLTTNSDFLFFDKSTEANITRDLKNQSVNAVKPTIDVQVETEEILENYVVEDLYMEDRPISIFVTNEKQEEIESYANFVKKSSEVSIIEDDLPEGLKESIRTSRKIRRSSGFRWRAAVDQHTQTDDKVFLQAAKAEEDELLDWMTKDRKEYLKGIQKQIFHKKSELSRVNILVSKGKSLLGESFNIDDSKLHTSLLSESNEEALDSEIHYLRTVGLLNSEAEVESWKNGYYFGYEKGKNDAALNAEAFVEDKEEIIDILKEATETNNEETPDINLFEERKSLKTSLVTSNTLKSVRKSTKVQEFNFQHKGLKLYWRTNIKPKYVEEFLKVSSKTILSHAKMSRKMTLKTINSLYSASIVKKNTAELADLATFTYEEFCTRYGQKLVVNKKLVDFLASILKYPDSRKTINFAKLIGISQKIGLEDYVRPKQSFRLLIDLLDSLSKSNLGIIVNIDEALDYQFIPAIRAIECSKEVLSKYIENYKMQSVIAAIEKNSHTDPKKINKFGIVDQEFLQEHILTEFDNWNQAILKCIWTVLESFYFSTDIFRVYKHDFVMMIKHISPHRFQAFGMSENGKKIMTAQVKETLSVKKLIEVCFEFSLLMPKDLEGFVTESLILSVKEDIVKNSARISSGFDAVFTARDNYSFSEQYALEWKERFSTLKESSEIPAQHQCILYKIITLELTRMLGPELFH